MATIRAYAELGITDNPADLEHYARQG